jgi:hypothetical protein
VALSCTSKVGFDFARRGRVGVRHAPAVDDRPFGRLARAALAEPATAQTSTRSFYNERGSFAGQSFTRGNSTSFSDGKGRFSGSAIRHGNSTSFYDARGRYTGSVINTSPRR